MTKRARGRVVPTAVFTAVLVFGTGVAASATPGEPAQQFGNDGVATLGGRPGPFRALAVQRDGKIVTIIEQDSGPVLVRLTASGRLDTTFSRDGKVPLGDAFGEVAGLALDGNKVVVAATADEAVTGRFVRIGRLTGTGVWDRSFAGDGRADLDAPGDVTHLAGVAIGPSHSIVLPANVTRGEINSMVVSRLTSEGVLDESFSRDGSASIPAPSLGVPIAGSVDVGPDGEIVLASALIAPTSITTVVSRIDERGKAVRGFGTDGWAQVAVDGRAYTDTYQVAFDDAGRVVGGGTTTPDGSTDFRMFAFRLTAAGQLDTRFAGDGTRTIALGSADAIGGVISQQEDGDMVLAGANRAGSMLVVRLTPRGAFDASFSDDGRALVSAAPDRLASLAIAVAPDQARVYVAAAKGIASPGSASVVAVRLT